MSYNQTKTSDILLVKIMSNSFPPFQNVGLGIKLRN